MTDLGLLMLMLFAVAAGVDVVVATVLVFVSLTEGVGNRQADSSTSRPFAD